MFQNKLLQLLIVILIAITLILGAFFILWEYMDNKAVPADPNAQAARSVDSVKAEKLSAKEKRELTVEINDILTNLKDGDSLIKISFAFELENKKTKEEFEQQDFVVKSIVIQTLADMTPEQVRGSKGYDNLTAQLMNKINPILTEGKLKQIHITNVLLQ